MEAGVRLTSKTTLRGDVSWFASGWGGSHEIKFGAGWKRAEADSINTTAGNKTQARINNAPGHQPSPLLP